MLWRHPRLKDGQLVKYDFKLTGKAEYSAAMNLMWTVILPWRSLTWVQRKIDVPADAKKKS